MEEDNEEDSDENSDDEEEDDNDNGTTDKSKKKDELTAKPNGCIVGDGSIHDGYTILMTKVDVSFGAWGMYNFYRMQVYIQMWGFISYTGANLPVFF